ncbi:hypothetical protein ThrDRAFT_04656 [Frankia casuarinae]|nr:hypothetical protein CcI6DRAFT_03933 [Frankia sp. CcI6]EYT89727.1 hypothetical protein ThrDRAFT_04656 [Frankia casuarinae]KFB03157.1 hypothetical protein ALLO2DRAFT_04126 [Frankia sp. Allo2]OAA20615.1 hypothetical protein AAY23_10912 [Frankia casuarinae]
MQRQPVRRTVAVAGPGLGTESSRGSRRPDAEGFSRASGGRAGQSPGVSRGRLAARTLPLVPRAAAVREIFEGESR